MNTKWGKYAICLFVISMSVAGCAPGQLFGSTVTPTLIPTATATPAPTFTPTPEYPTFTRDNGIEISRSSGTAGEGEISFDVGASENTLKIVKVNGINGVKDPPEVESLGYNLLVLEYPQMTNSTNAIIAGDDGATLKKEGKFFFLVDGSAHLEKK